MPIFYHNSLNSETLFQKKLFTFCHMFHKSPLIMPHTNKTISKTNPQKRIIIHLPILLRKKNTNAANQKIPPTTALDCSGLFTFTGFGPWPGLNASVIIVPDGSSAAATPVARFTRTKFNPSGTAKG